MRSATMRTQAQPDHLGHAVRESRLRCDRSVQRGIEDRAPAGDGSQILVARFPRSITQEAVLVHLGGTRLPHGGIHVGEPIAEHGTA